MKPCPVGTARDVARFAAVIAALSWSIQPAMAEGEPRTSSDGPAVGVPLHAAADTEVLLPERGTSSALSGAGAALEEPLNPEKYACGRGDVFDLNFWGAQNFKVRVTVDTEGRAFLPKVGYITVVGKTLSQARTEVKKAVARYYPGLNIDMSLQQPRTFLVHAVGFVGKPGIYPASPVQRVSALLDGTGLSGRGSRRRIEIKRRDGRIVVADLVRYDMTGETAFNPYLMDGDVVTVPFADVVVHVDGAVKRAGNFELINSKDVAELLDLAGGFRPDVTHSLPIRLIRRNKNEHSEQTLQSFGNDGKAPNVALHDGDELFIPSVSELQRSVLLIGPVPGATPTDEVTMAKRLPYVEGATVRALVDGSASSAASADLKHAYIKPAKGDVIPIDLEALLVRRDFSADRPVHMGDTIVIPQKRRAVVVEGAVYKPGIYPYNPNFTSAQYIAVAGGPSRMAQSSSSFRLVSPDGRVRQIGRGMLVDPGDTLVLPERTFSRSEVVSLVMGGVGLLLSGVAVMVVVFKK